MDIIRYIKSFFRKQPEVIKTEVQKRTYDKSIPIKHEKIYQDIILEANNMVNLLSQFISVTAEGQFECEILLASTIVERCQKVHLVNALYIANKDMGLNFYAIEKKLDYYCMLHNKLIWSLDNIELWSYREFAKMWKGEPQFRGLIKPDKYLNNNHAIFTHEEGWMQQCSFFMIPPEHQNAMFIKEHQDDLLVRKGTATDYVIMPKEYANYNKNVFFYILIYWIYCNPLENIKMLQVDKLSDELKHDKEVLNELRERMKNAFEQAVKSLHCRFV